jgi:DNA-directed RNA polymerase subunit L
MDPIISNISHDDDKYKFTISNVDVSYINAIRRTILTDIQVNGIYTETYENNDCFIEKNTSRLHNEIIKQRLSCIPIHTKNLEDLPGKYELVVDIKNETDTNIIVTTEDFKIRSKASGNYLTEDAIRKIFPKNDKTGMYIDFVRLRAKIDDSMIPGEELKIVADFSIQSARQNSMYNVVSICSYGNTIDMIQVNNVWEQQEKKLVSENLSNDEIKMQKRNFYILDAQRHYKEKSFDFVIQSIGIYTNEELMKKSCKFLINQFLLLLTDIDSESLRINDNETTMDNSYDIIIETGDYTIGNILDFMLYDKLYKTGILTFSGFKKMHPHDDSGVLRLSFKNVVTKREIEEHLNKTCMEIIQIFEQIYKLF